MLFWPKCHTSDVELSPVQQISKLLLGAITGNVDFDHVVKTCLPGLFAIKLPFTLHHSQIPCGEMLRDCKYLVTVTISPTRWNNYWWLSLESIMMVITKWWYSYSIISSALIKASKQMNETSKQMKKKGKLIILVLKLPQIWPVVAISSSLHVFVYHLH